MTSPRLPDAEHRALITSALDQTLFVEAGAGTGKTTALVGRIVALIRSGVPIERLAAITFTEKAAAELAERVRKELEKAAHGHEDYPGIPLEEQERCRAAIR
ncbi:MAG TPA: UvrD-helicase domain-containing protein, partial [Tepidiformaceae bacterium]|nr:UvrD-helicase domain-containing protein [Tepidiformaceae bacterium]